MPWIPIFSTLMLQRAIFPLYAPQHYIQFRHKNNILLNSAVSFKKKNQVHWNPAFYYYCDFYSSALSEEKGQVFLLFTNLENNVFHIHGYSFCNVFFFFLQLPSLEGGVWERAVWWSMLFYGNNYRRILKISSEWTFLGRIESESQSLSAKGIYYLECSIFSHVLRLLCHTLSVWLVVCNFIWGQTYFCSYFGIVYNVIIFYLSTAIITMLLLEIVNLGNLKENYLLLFNVSTG